MMSVDNDGRMIFGDLGGLKLPEICLTGEENPEKTSPRKLVLNRDRTQARCMTGMHATTWSTIVDPYYIILIWCRTALVWITASIMLGMDPYKSWMVISGIL